MDYNTPAFPVQICWHIKCSILTASFLRIWNSSAGIPSPPLALFVVMLPKAHLTLHSSMSDSRWVTTPLWLSGSLRPFLYSCSVYSCHFFLISSASVRSLPFLSFQILYIISYIWNLERWYWWSYMQGSKGNTDVKSRLLDSVEEGIYLSELCFWFLQKNT